MDFISYAAEAGLVALGCVALGAITRALWEWIGR